jgi:ribosomal protein L12E/L44/L45/RPP1/RPP2
MKTNNSTRLLEQRKKELRLEMASTLLSYKQANHYLSEGKNLNLVENTFKTTLPKINESIRRYSYIATLQEMAMGSDTMIDVANVKHVLADLSQLSNTLIGHYIRNVINPDKLIDLVSAAVSFLSGYKKVAPATEKALLSKVEEQLGNAVEFLGALDELFVSRWEELKALVTQPAKKSFFGDKLTSLVKKAFAHVTNFDVNVFVKELREDANMLDYIKQIVEKTTAEAFSISRFAKKVQSKLKKSFGQMAKDFIGSFGMGGSTGSPLGMKPTNAFEI